MTSRGSDVGHSDCPVRYHFSLHACVPLLHVWRRRRQPAAFLLTVCKITACDAEPLWKRLPQNESWEDGIGHVGDNTNLERRIPDHVHQRVPDLGIVENAVSSAEHGPRRDPRPPGYTESRCPVVQILRKQAARHITIP